MMDSTTLELYQKNLYLPKGDIVTTLGVLAKNLYYITDYNLSDKEGYFSTRFYKLIFKTLVKIHNQNPLLKEVNLFDFQKEMSFNPLSHIYFDNEGDKFFHQLLTRVEKTLDMEYLIDILSKFHLLRNCLNIGIDSRVIYDPKKQENETQENFKLRVDEFNHKTRFDLLQEVENLVFQLKKDTLIDSSNKIVEAKVGDGIDDCLKNILNGSEFGIPYHNSYLNTIFRGLRRGCYYIDAANTGTSKTRNILLNSVMISCSEIFNVETMKFDKLPWQKPCIIMNSELQLKKLQKTLIAIVSGVPEKLLNDVDYLKQHKEIYDRIERSLIILKNANLKIFCCEDLSGYSCKDIENIISKNILEYDCYYYFFDYIQITSNLTQGYKLNFGYQGRPDEVLRDLSTRLRMLCEKYDVMIYTASQLNRNATDRSQRNSNALAGASSISEKGMCMQQMYRVRQEDLDNVKKIIEKINEGNFGEPKKPNYMRIITKNTDNESEMILWSDMNLGSMRENVLFVTDTNYNIMTDIMPTIIKYREI